MHYTWVTGMRMRVLGESDAFNPLSTHDVSEARKRRRCAMSRTEFGREEDAMYAACAVDPLSVPARPSEVVSIVDRAAGVKTAAAVRIACERLPACEPTSAVGIDDGEGFHAFAGALDDLSDPTTMFPEELLLLDEIVADVGAARVATTDAHVDTSLLKEGVGAVEGVEVREGELAGAVADLLVGAGGEDPTPSAVEVLGELTGELVEDSHPPDPYVVPVPVGLLRKPNGDVVNAAGQTVAKITCWPRPIPKYHSCACRMHGAKCSVAKTLHACTDNEFLQWVMRGDTVALPSNFGGLTNVVKKPFADQHIALFADTLAQCRSGNIFG